VVGCAANNNLKISQVIIASELDLFFRQTRDVSDCGNEIQYMEYEKIV
jgi:hypothetical protein